MKTFAVCELLPDYECRLGEISAPYDCENEYTGVSIVGTTYAEFSAYVDAILATGAKIYTKTEIAGNHFATLLITADGVEYAVHLMYYPIRGNSRVVWGKKGFLPTLDKAVFESGNVRTSILQYSRNGVWNSQPATGAPGMAYIITLADGTFLLIDGGPRQREQHFTKAFVDGEWVDAPQSEEHDCDKLYRLLCERTPAGQKPVISAWFITHGHSDHTDLAGDFLRKYKDKVEVRIAAYNLPDPLKHPVKNEPSEILHITLMHIVKGFEQVGATHWKLHTGQRMSFPGCEVEILHTHEDYFPKSYAWGNHTSSAFRLHFKGKTFMVLGDCESDICHQLCYKYGKYLQSDILQPTHHGANGGTTDLNAVIDPDICLWSIDAWRFHTDARMLGFQRGYECNWVLRNDEFKVREHHHNCEDTEIFTD